MLGVRLVSLACIWAIAPLDSIPTHQALGGCKHPSSCTFICTRDEPISAKGEGAGRNAFGEDA